MCIKCVNVKIVLACDDDDDRLMKTLKVADN